MMDNYGLYLRHDAEQERLLRKLPLCACCGQEIQSDYKYCVTDGWVCEDCLKDYYRERIDND